MAEVSMPRLSDTMQEGTIATWLKKPGEQVSRGEVIAQIETDKATMDLTAFEAGMLEEILAPEGTTVPIGQPVARIGSGKTKAASKQDQPSTTQPRADAAGSRGSEAARPAEEADAVAPSVDAAPPEAEAEPTTAAASPPEAAADHDAAQAEPSAAHEVESQDGSDAHDVQSQEGSDGKVRASPMARHMAVEHGLDLSKLSGSGPRGRVIRADVEAALSSTQPTDAAAPAARPDIAPGMAATREAATGAAAPEAAGPDAKPAARQTPTSEDDERVPLSQMRRTIARRMAESTSTVPHFFLTTTVDVTEMVRLRKQLVEQTADAGLKITFGDLVVKGAALSLRSVPEVNVSFAGDSLVRHKRIHVGIAVATDRGLIVPVLRDADQKSLGEINRQTTDLAERARSGKLQPTDYAGGTFTISNLGMFGVEQFNAVINPPEAAILAVGAIVRQPAEHDGQIVLREQMKLTLSVDHRALDGATGAGYLRALKQLLEKPMLLLV